MSKFWVLRGALAVAAAVQLTMACTVRDEILPDTYVEGNVPALTGHQSATFTFSSDEAEVAFHCAIDESPFARCESPYTTPALADGAHTFWVKAVDIAGNEDDSPASFAWTIDSNLPTLSIAGPADYTREMAANLTIVSSKPVLSIECRMGDQPFAPCAEVTATTAAFHDIATAEGPRVLEVRATDSVGFTAEAIHDWTVDTTPPVLSAPSKPDELNNDTSISVGFDANEIIASAICRYDGGTATECNSLNFYHSPVGQGAHHVSIQAQDRAGNASTLTVTWQTDLTKPILLVGHSGGKWTVRSNKRTRVVATGLNAIIEANVVRQWGTAPGSLGTHSISVTGTDMAGNVTVNEYSYCNDNPSGTVCD